MAMHAHQPEPESARWLDRDEHSLAGVLSRFTDVVAVGGEGSWLIDVDGRRYLDLTSGLAVTTTGHCHPRVVNAVQRQAHTLMHTSVVAHHTPAVELAERLRGKTPFLDDPQVFFCNTGAEAVDGALKLARRVTGRPGVIAFQHAFHGRTLGATSITTAKPQYQQGYEPLLPGIRTAPYADPLRISVDEALDAFDELVAPDIGAVIVEPVLGEGGYVVPGPGWLQGLRERCDRHGMLLIFDEVQTGAGRTGRFFCAETIGVSPDVVLFAKGIASGLPLGGIIAGRELMSRWPRTTHGSTFGGNPVSCAAALATLEVIDEVDLCRRARVLGARALSRLREAASGCSAVVDVRGLGLMVAVELDSTEACARVRRHCLDRGVIVISCGPHDNIVRLIPPLTITDAELQTGLDAVASALAAEA